MLKNRLIWQPTLRTKLLLSFAGMLILFLGMVAFSFIEMQGMRKKVDIQNEKANLEHQALELKVYVQELKDISSGLMISRDSNYVQKFNEKRKPYSDMIKTVGDTAYTPEQQQWRSQLIMASTEFLNIFDRAAAIIQDKSLKEQDIRLNTSILYEQAQEQRDIIFKLVDQFDHAYSKDASDAANSTYASMDRTIQIMLLLGIFVLIAGSVIAYFLIRAMIGPIRKLQQAVSIIAAGDLRHRIGSVTQDELGTLSRDFDRMTESVKAMIGSTQQIAAALAEHVESSREFSGRTAEANIHIVKAIEEIAAGADQQATQAERSAVVLGDLSDQIDGFAQFAADAREKSDMAAVQTDTGAQAMKSLQVATVEANALIEAVTVSMRELLESSTQIGKIVTAISQIAGETNVLALNAAIEAARAGAHGRGFSVVAEQIRSLSNDTSSAAKNASALVSGLERRMSELEGSMSKARQGLSKQNNKVNVTLTSFGGIRASMQEMNAMFAEVSNQVGTIHSRNKELMEAVHQVAGIAQETAAAVEEVGSSSQEQDVSVRKIARQADDIHGLSQQLYEQVSLFQIDNPPKSEAKL